MDIDFAYLAGYIDGDGCFYIGKNINPIKYRSGIVISSTNKDTLRFFWKKFGGNVIFGKPNPKFKSYNPINQWYTGGNNARILVDKITPFLREKLEDANIFVQFMEETNRSNKEQHILKIRDYRANYNLVTLEKVEEINQIIPASTPNDFDYAYLAGFIDSECALCLSRYKVKNKPNYLYKALLQCNNTKTGTIAHLKNTFGGFCYFVPRKAKNALHNNQIAWRISSRQLAELLPKICPYLKNKKQVCEKLIEFSSTILKNGGDRQKDHLNEYREVLEVRENIFNQISHLNSKSTI